MCTCRYLSPSKTNMVQQASREGVGQRLFVECARHPHPFFWNGEKQYVCNYNRSVVTKGL